MIKIEKHPVKNRKRLDNICFVAFFISMVMLLITIPVSTFAADVKLDSMNVRISPEYDDPRTLVILEPVVSSDTNLPATMRFLVSKKHTPIKIGMACEVASGGGHQCKAYQTNDAGDFNEISYDAQNSRNLFMEYYYGQRKPTSDKREIIYEYKTPITVKQLDIQIQKPKNAKNYKIEPSSSTVSKDQDGIDIYAYSYANFKPGKVIRFKISYDSGGLSKPKVPKNKISFIPTKLSGYQWLLLLLIPVSAVAFYYGRSKIFNSAAYSKKGNKRNYNPPKKKQGTKFCTNCGNDLKGDKNFCSSCGEKI